MNTKYETGNVIRNTTGVFLDFKFPNELPTEEWAGNEVRSYQNYIRPVANLFENDRENLSLIKDIYKSLNPLNENAVISGCEVVKTGNYYEVKHGAFLKDGVLYYIYPACEAVAQQLESEYRQVKSGDLRIKIVYSDDTYTYSYSINGGAEVTSEAVFNTAAALISDIFEELELSLDVDKQVILPIFTISQDTSTKIFFNGSMNTGATVPSNSVIFAEITNGTVNNSVKTKTTIDGNRINAATINNSSIINNKVTIGSTNVPLGSIVADFDGINTINDIRLFIDGNDGSVVINNGSTKGIKANSNYVLDTACAKAYTEDTTLASTGEKDKLPTAATVKTYVDGKIQTAVRTGTINFNAINVTSTASFANTVTLGNNAKIVENNTADASRESGSVSGTASIYTKGGIEAKGNIYSDKDIVGMNNGTYSLRSLKENITPFRKSAVKLINDVKIVNYNYIADAEKNHKVGFIADDTDELLSTKNHNIMDQSNCIGILLKAVQELSAEVKKLKEEINGIKSDSGEK